MRVSLLAASALCIALLAGTGQAQVPATSSSALPLPSPGFMPPYEIARTVRRAGFDPLAPPLREGSTYVVRATDFRGILMRVVVDAHSGAIRDASRIVPGPGSYGSQAAMAPYEPLLNEVPAYGPSADYDGAPPPLDDGEMLAPRPAATHPLTRTNITILPPLPRPRPPELAARAPLDGAKSAEEPKAKPEVTGSAAVAAPAVPAATSPAPQASSSQPVPPATATVKPGKSFAPPAIND